MHLLWFYNIIIFKHAIIDSKYKKKDEDNFIRRPFFINTYTRTKLDSTGASAFN